MLSVVISKFSKPFKFAYLSLYIANRKGIQIHKGIFVTLRFLFTYFFDYRPAMRRGYISREEATDRNPYAENVLIELDKVIISKMHFMQYEIPFDCARFMIVSNGDGGFGYAILGPLTSNLAMAYLYNRTVIFEETNVSPYDFPFKSIGTYTRDDVEGEVRHKTKGFTYLLKKDRLLKQVQEGKGWRFLRKTHLFRSNLSFTEPLTRLPDSFVYMKGLILDSFLEMKEDYRLPIQECMKQIDFIGSPVLGAHIRHGDVHTSDEDAYRRYTSSHYFRVIEQAVERTGIRKVFIATDSDEVLKQLPKDSGINFIYDDKEKRHDGHVVSIISKDRALRKQETLTALKNIYMLGACDYIIGSWGAQFIRFSASIAYFRRKKRNLILIKGNDIEFITDDEYATHNKDDDYASIILRW